MNKRRLSEPEISSIIGNIQDHLPNFLPTDLREGYLQKIITPLRQQLEKVEVVDHPEIVDRLREKVHASIQRSIVQAGEGVGVICAQSIGERQTQLTLNSFHQSGLSVATVVTGVPRFLELLNATKDPKMSSNRFHLSVDGADTPQKMRDTLRHHIVHVSFFDLVVRDTIHQDKEEEVWYGAFETVYSNQFRDYHACLSFELDLKKMQRYKVSPRMISERLESQFTDICCVFSPLHIGQLDVFVDITQVTLPETEAVPAFLNSGNYINVFLEDIVKVKLLEIKICGLSGVKNYHILKDDGGFHVETEGSNLEGLVALPFVDIGTVRSNNMWDIYHVMGIEATREFLLEEFTSIVSSDGTFLNPVHILLLVDIMTHHGTINSVSRYGLKKEQVGVLSRSSFEESLDHFCNAGFYAEKEPVKAVSAAIMCGKRSKIGSGLCSLLMDWSTVRQHYTQNKSE